MNKPKATTKSRSYELKKLKAESVAEENKRFLLSQKTRSHGSSKAEPGIKGLKTTKSEVFIYLVGKEDDVKALQEQFTVSIKSYRKTKTFTSASEVQAYLEQSKYPANSIIILIYTTPEVEDEFELSRDFDIISQIKKNDPSLDTMILTAGAKSSAFDFTIAKGSDALGKIVTNITWAIREQERIRKQVESKQFIKMAIIVFFSFFFILFAIDLISGIMSPTKQGLLGIVPIPQ